MELLANALFALGSVLSACPLLFFFAWCLGADLTWMQRLLPFPRAAKRVDTRAKLINDPEFIAAVAHNVVEKINKDILAEPCGLG